MGGGGFAPLEGGPEGTCELRKMYFYPDVRGLGVGDALLDRILAAAERAGFEVCYLETLVGMTAARRLYEKKGFTRLPCARGSTGHYGCDAFYEKQLVCRG